MGRVRAAAATLATALLLSLATACQMMPAPTPQPSTAPSAVPPFTVSSTDPITTTDPAAVTDQGSAVLELNVFQRLMTTEPGETALKPDGARDCVFTAATVYTCTLFDNSFFHNGHALTSSDVKFSIQRARRLAVPGSSASLLGSLVRIETPDPVTVRFVLRHVDTQFGFALASPAASIVDEQVYSATQLRTADQPIIGSGPFSVVTFTGRRLVLQRYQAYVGKNAAQVAALSYTVAASPAALEAAISNRMVDVAGRGLSSAALARLGRQVETNGNQLTDTGYRLQTIPGARVRMLVWNPDTFARVTSAQRIAAGVAVQPDRTVDSVVPTGVDGHVGGWPMGGTAVPQISWQGRVAITLGYRPTDPDAADLAALVRDRLDATGGFSVRLVTSGEADLSLVDRKAWTPTAGAWLQPYVSAPPPVDAEVIATVWNRYLTETDPTAADRIVAALQRQAIGDATVIPLTQSDEVLLVRDNATVPQDSFGPGWQLGFFWMRRA